MAPARLGRRPAADDPGRHRRFQRRRGRGQHHGAALEPGAGQRHVAGVVVDGLLLLEAGIVLLVDDDQAEVDQRQEQGGAGADHDVDRSLGDQPPGSPPLRPGQCRVPHRRRRAEPPLEPAQPLRRKRDLGQKHEHAPTCTQGGGHGLEIDLGLAGAGHPVEQCHACPARDQLAQPAGGGMLWRRQLDAPAVGIGPRPGGPVGQWNGCQQSVARHGLHHAGADTGRLGQGGGGQAGAVRQRRQDRGTLTARPRGWLAIGPAIGELAGPGLQRRGDAERELQDRSARRQRLLGDMRDQRPERRRHRRRVEDRAQRLEPVARDRSGRGLVPHHPDQLAAREGHGDERPGRRCLPVLQQIVERAVERDGHQDGHDGAEQQGGRPGWALTGSGLIASSPRQRQPKDSLASPCRRRPRARRRRLARLAAIRAAGGRPDAERLRRGSGCLSWLHGRPPRRAGRPRRPRRHAPCRFPLLARLAASTELRAHLDRAGHGGRARLLPLSRSPPRRAQPGPAGDAHAAPAASRAAAAGRDRRPRPDPHRPHRRAASPGWACATPRCFCCSTAPACASARRCP